MAQNTWYFSMPILYTNQLKSDRGLLALPNGAKNMWKGIKSDPHFSLYYGLFEKLEITKFQQIKDK